VSTHRCIHREGLYCRLAHQPQGRLPHNFRNGAYPPMTISSSNRFQQFFEADRYTGLKNLLYNYRLRKRSVSARLATHRPGRLLEIGCGMSPMIDRADCPAVYTDLSFSALILMRRLLPHGGFVVADATRMPFKTGVFDQAVSSEVLEHIPDDRKALEEACRVLQLRGELILTVPHRMAYFAVDDRYVRHFRRYEINGLLKLLRDAGFRVTRIDKVLGPLEKLAMMLAVNLFRLAGRRDGRDSGAGNAQRRHRWLVGAFGLANRLYMALAWLETRYIPLAMATVILVDARKVEPVE